MRFFIISLTLIVIGCSSNIIDATSQSDADSLIFYGIVIDDDTKLPIEDAFIVVKTNTPWKNCAYSGADGMYYIYGDIGSFTEYIICVEAEGYIPMGLQLIGQFTPPIETNMRLTPEVQ